MMGGRAGGEHVVGGDRVRGAAWALTKTILFLRPGRHSLRYSGQGWNGGIVTSWGACWRRRRRWEDGATTWSCRPTGRALASFCGRDEIDADWEIDAG